MATSKEWVVPAGIWIVAILGFALGVTGGVVRHSAMTFTGFIITSLSLCTNALVVEIRKIRDR
jgi:hypothetical protein